MIKDDLLRTWTEYSEDLCNMDKEDGVTVNMCGFNGAKKDTYNVGGASRTEVEVRVVRQHVRMRIHDK